MVYKQEKIETALYIALEEISKNARRSNNEWIGINYCIIDTKSIS